MTFLVELGGKKEFCTSADMPVHGMESLKNG